MASSENEPGRDDDLDLVVVAEPRDVSEEVIAKSLLEDAGIPFDCRNEGLQDLFGMGQIGGTNFVVGPVKILVPEAYAEEARQLLAGDRRREDGRADRREPTIQPEDQPAAGEFRDDIVGEMEPEPPEIPDHPNTARVRAAAIFSLLCSIFFFGSLLSAAATLAGMFALAAPSEGVPNHWRVFALVGTFAGLIGSWVWLTAVG